MNCRMGALTLIVMLLTGCADEKILEKVGFVRTLAMDVDEQNPELIKVSISIPKVVETQSIYYTTIAKTSKEAKFNFDRQNNRRIVNGQLRQVIFGEKLARKSVWKHMDAVFRDPSVGIHAHVIVAEGDIEHLMRRQYQQGGNAGEYIDNLLRAEVSSRDSFDTNLHSFLRDYYDDGIESSATIIKESMDGIVINGVALFKNDRYVAKVSSVQKMFFDLLRNHVKMGDLYLDAVETPKETIPVSMMYVSSQRKIKVLSMRDILEGQPPKIQVNLKVRGSLLEYYGSENLDHAATQQTLEKGMENFIQKRCEEILKIMQEGEADAIGIGQYVRNKMRYKDWKKLDWPATFAKADIQVKVDVKIKNYGKLLKS